MAELFGAAGWHIVIHHLHSEEEAESLLASVPSGEIVCFDVADREAVAAHLADLASRLGDWRALVNCASVFEFDDAERIDPDVFGHAMRVNAEAPVMMAQQYFALAHAQSGRRAINVLDQKLANLNPDFFSYTMAKAALQAATGMLAMAVDGDDRVYGLHPGAMLPSFDQADAEHERSGRMNLLNRLTTPGELADAALFLATGALANGETIYVDSGQHLMNQNRDVLFLARAQD